MMHQTLPRLSRQMLILSEADVRKCLPIDLAIRANRRALGSLRRDGDGGATVPTRIGLPYRGTGGASSAAEDWTLFKPAAYSSPTSSSDTGTSSDNDDEPLDLMGMKLVSVRGGNPALGLPTVPATVILVECVTGQVSALLGGTYLTAARTAAGSAVATDIIMSPDLKDNAPPLHLTVFGAGLQAELHIDAMRSVRRIGSISVVNRSAGRAEALIEKMHQRVRDDDTEQQDILMNVVLLDDRDAVMQAVSKADIICTTTNTTTPLFDGNWVKPGCHVNGIGSYTENMIEIDKAFVSSRCKVVIDTVEALDVGDLKLISDTSENYIGLLGDVMAGRTTLELSSASSDDSLDCTLFKSVGTAIQDVITAHEVYMEATKRGVGVHVEM